MGASPGTVLTTLLGIQFRLVRRRLQPALWLLLLANLLFWVIKKYSGNPLYLNIDITFIFLVSGSFLFVGEKSDELFFRLMNVSPSEIWLSKGMIVGLIWIAEGCILNTLYHYG